jgi:hypothetical protein
VVVCEWMTRALPVLAAVAVHSVAHSSRLPSGTPDSHISECDDMRTPALPRRGFPIAVMPPQAALVSAQASGPPSQAEAWEIARAIKPRFAEFAGRYDEKKYWPAVYQRVRREFRDPTGVAPGIIREALLWKYGHLGKPAIPPAHELLISQLQRGWLTAMAAIPRAPEDAFVALHREFGGTTRFVTIAFLVHLLHPREVPIIDQHNFRAVNALLAGARPTWRSKARPSRYADIALVATFMKSVTRAWGRRAPASVPSARDLDKFLMMYGKSIKGAV